MANYAAGVEPCRMRAACCAHGTKTPRASIESAADPGDVAVALHVTALERGREGLGPGAAPRCVRAVDWRGSVGNSYGSGCLEPFPRLESPGAHHGAPRGTGPAHRDGQGI